MSDDTNITDLNKGQQQGRRAKSAKELMGEIRGEHMSNKAKEMKVKLKAAMDEREKMADALKLADAKIEKMAAEYDAEINASV